MIILSHFQVEPLLQKEVGKIKISLDLGLTESEVELKSGRVFLPGGQFLSLEKIKRVYKNKNKCFIVQDNEVMGIVVHSAKTNWVRTLYPTKGAPTTMVSGILMHRIKNMDPIEDTKLKVGALGYIKRDEVLDTATGLGYSAIELSKFAKVTTVELDPGALEIAKYNPWSRKLFNNTKITQIIGDLLVEIDKFKDESFMYIFHDPPTFKLAGDLYSFEVYRKFKRILKPGGRLFHYIGDPNSEHGAIITKGVIKRLQEAGFKVEKKPEEFGVLAL